MYLYPFAPVYSCIYIHDTHVHPVLMYIYTHPCIYKNMRMYNNTYTENMCPIYIHAGAYAYVNIHIHVSTYMHVDTCMHTRTHHHHPCDEAIASLSQGALAGFY